MKGLAMLVETWTSETAAAAFASTSLISIVPNVLLILFPALSTPTMQSQVWWQWGQALAAGSLLGDVFWHTLPHVMEEHEEHATHHHEEDMDMGSWILAGFSFFFVVDVLLHIAEDWVSTTKETPSKKSDKETHKINWSLVVLNVVADALHNFSDGLAIGAAYAGGDTMGQVATLSILLHEVPHELGDYCSLVSAGYTPWQAVQTQFGTAVAALAGTALALVAQQEATHGKALPLATAGGFVYLAGTTLIPHVMHQPVPRPWYRLGHLVAFVVGLAFMYGVAWMEHVGDGDHHPHHHHNHHDHSGEL